MRTAEALAAGWVICTLFVCGAFAQRHERHATAVEESSKPANVAGGVTFQVQKAYDSAYENVLNFLKRQGYVIDSASKEVGQITTAMTVKGGWHQTGTRVMVTLIKDTDSATTVRVAVTEQKRYKGLQTEPWGDAKVVDKSSKEVSDHIKSALAGS